jgi:uncharacterized protein
LALWSINQLGIAENLLSIYPDLTFSDGLRVKDLEGKIVVSRTTEGLLVQVKGQTKTALECVYCLDKYDRKLELDFIEMFSFPSHALEDTELILPDDFQINLSPLIREYLYLDIPINPVCQPSCKGLCPVCGENLNETDCQHDENTIDDRLSILKTLLTEDSAEEE